MSVHSMHLLGGGMKQRTVMGVDRGHLWNIEGQAVELWPGKTEDDSGQKGYLLAES